MAGNSPSDLSQRSGLPVHHVHQYAHHRPHQQQRRSQRRGGVSGDAAGVDDHLHFQRYQRRRHGGGRPELRHERPCSYPQGRGHDAVADGGSRHRGVPAPADVSPSGADPALPGGRSRRSGKSPDLSFRQSLVDSGVYHIYRKLRHSPWAGRIRPVPCPERHHQRRLSGVQHSVSECASDGYSRQRFCPAAGAVHWLRRVRDPAVFLESAGKNDLRADIHLR